MVKPNENDLNIVRKPSLSLNEANDLASKFEIKEENKKLNYLEYIQQENREDVQIGNIAAVSSSGIVDRDVFRQNFKKAMGDSAFKSEFLLRFKSFAAECKNDKITYLDPSDGTEKEYSLDVFEQYHSKDFALIQIDDAYTDYFSLFLMAAGGATAGVMASKFASFLGSGIIRSTLYGVVTGSIVTGVAYLFQKMRAIDHMNSLINKDEATFKKVIKNYPLPVQDAHDFFVHYMKNNQDTYMSKIVSHFSDTDAQKKAKYDAKALIRAMRILIIQSIFMEKNELLSILKTIEDNNKTQHRLYNPEFHDVLVEFCKIMKEYAEKKAMLETYHEKIMRIMQRIEGAVIPIAPKLYEIFYSVEKSLDEYRIISAIKRNFVYDKKFFRIHNKKKFLKQMEQEINESRKKLKEETINFEEKAKKLEEFFKSADKDRIFESKKRIIEEVIQGLRENKQSAALANSSSARNSVWNASIERISEESARTKSNNLKPCAFTADVDFLVSAISASSGKMPSRSEVLQHFNSTEPNKSLIAKFGDKIKISVSSAFSSLFNSNSKDMITHQLLIDKIIQQENKPEMLKAENLESLMLMLEKIEERTEKKSDTYFGENKKENFLDLINVILESAKYSRRYLKTVYHMFSSENSLYIHFINKGFAFWALLERALVQKVGNPLPASTLQYADPDLNSFHTSHEQQGISGLQVKIVGRILEQLSLSIHSFDFNIKNDLTIKDLSQKKAKSGGASDVDNDLTDPNLFFITFIRFALNCLAHYISLSYSISMLNNARYLLAYFGERHISHMHISLLLDKTLDHVKSMHESLDVFIGTCKSIQKNNEQHILNKILFPFHANTTAEETDLSQLEQMNKLLHRLVGAISETSHEFKVVENENNPHDKNYAVIRHESVAEMNEKLDSYYTFINIFHKNKNDVDKSKDFLKEEYRKFANSPKSKTEENSKLIGTAGKPNYSLSDSDKADMDLLKDKTSELVEGTESSRKGVNVAGGAAAVAGVAVAGATAAAIAKNTKSPEHHMMHAEALSKEEAKMMDFSQKKFEDLIKAYQKKNPNFKIPEDDGR